MTAESPTYPVRVVGHAGTALIGVLLIVAAVASVSSSLPMVFTVALALFGLAGVTLAYASWNGSRIGWSFATTLDGVVGVCTLFGSTKIAHLAGLPLGAALGPCALAIAACVALAMLHAEYDK